MEEKITNWLLARKISPSILEKSGVRWNGKKIVIPVRDLSGKVIFNKYRRDPFAVSSDEPKYSYDKGATSSLYGGHTLAYGKPIFIVEGELDALLLQSCGLEAVSSTGGSGSFKPEWATFLRERSNEIYICYDRDTAGYKGALRVQQMIPSAKIIMLPYTLKGKDVTDFFFQYKMPDFIKLVAGSESWYVEEDMETIPETKKEIKEVIKKILQMISEFDERRRLLISQDQSTEHVEIIMAQLDSRLTSWKRTLENFGNKDKFKSNDDIAKAKMYPITNIVKFNGGGFAKCLFHSDNTPSMKYYREKNVVHCFSCGKHGDSIEVFMAFHQCDFKAALKRMTT